MAGNNPYLRQPQGGINDEQNNQHNTHNNQQNNQPRAPANHPRASVIQSQGPQYTGQLSHQAPPMAFSRSGLNRDSGLLNSDGPSGFDRNAGFRAENGGSAASNHTAAPAPTRQSTGHGYGQGGSGQTPSYQATSDSYADGDAVGLWNGFTSQGANGISSSSYAGGEAPGHVNHWTERNFEPCANCYNKGYPNQCNSNGQPHSRLNPCHKCQNSVDKNGNVLECGKGAVRFPMRGGMNFGGAKPRGGPMQRGRDSARSGAGYGQQAPPPDFLEMRQQMQQEIREDLRREFDEKLRQQKQEQEEKLRQQKQEQENAALRERVFMLEMQHANTNANTNANGQKQEMEATLDRRILAERDRKRDDDILFLKLALQLGTASANVPSKKLYREQETSYSSNSGFQANLGMDGARRGRGGRGRRGRGGIRGGAHIGHTAPPVPTARPDGSRFLADRNENGGRRPRSFGTNDAQFNEPGNGQLTLVNRFQGMAVFDNEQIDDDADFLLLERNNRGLARLPRR